MIEDAISFTKTTLSSEICEEQKNLLNFEDDLIDALQPIRQFAKACAIYHLFDCGIFDLLYPAHKLTLLELVNLSSYKAEQLSGFINYLINENLLVQHGNTFSLSENSKKLHPFRSWYTMLIGGYGNTFLQIGDVLRQKIKSAPRDLNKVGVGSCGISHYDAIPLVYNLMMNIPGTCRYLLDLGCGNGQYLIEFCKKFPNIEACGIEPSEGGFQEAKHSIKKANLGHRIKLYRSTALDFFDLEISFKPDFIILGFVLHEVFGQDGIAGVKQFLNQITTKYPDIYLIIIEVDDKIHDPTIMKHGLSLAYYNPYYLLHYFTNQKLASQAFWDELFIACNLQIIAKETVDQKIDSTGLEIGYLLKKNL